MPSNYEIEQSPLIAEVGVTAVYALFDISQTLENQWVVVSWEPRQPAASQWNDAILRTFKNEYELCLFLAYMQIKGATFRTGREAFLDWKELLDDWAQEYGDENWNAFVVDVENTVLSGSARGQKN